MWPVKTKRATFIHLTWLGWLFNITLSECRETGQKSQTWYLPLILTTTSAVVQNNGHGFPQSRTWKPVLCKVFFIFVFKLGKNHEFSRTRTPTGSFNAVPIQKQPKRIKRQWQVISEPRKPLQTKLYLSSLTKGSHWRIWGQGWKVLYTVWRVKTVERTVHTFSQMIYFLAALEAAVTLLLSWEDLPNGPKGFPRPLYKRCTIQPLSTCFPVSLDLSLHLFVSHPADLNHPPLLLSFSLLDPNLFLISGVSNVSAHQSFEAFPSDLWSWLWTWKRPFTTNNVVHNQEVPTWHEDHRPHTSGPRGGRQFPFIKF